VSIYTLSNSLLENASEVNKFFGGLLICLSIIGIPFGLQLMKLGAAVMTPFGKELVESPFANNPLLPSQGKITV